MTTRDRTPEPPYCWQSKDALRRIESSHGDRTDKAHAIAVYVALTWFASDILKESFTIERSRIAERAGVSYRKAADVLTLLESLGIISIKSNLLAGSKEQGPCTYTLGTVCLRLGTDENFAPCREEEEEHKKNIRRTENKGAKRSRFDAGTVSLPFSSSAFQTAWSEWCKHRSELHKPLTPTSTAKQLAAIAAIGEQRAVAAITASIAAGWQGIFEPKAGQKPNGSASKYANAWPRETESERDFRNTGLREEIKLKEIDIRNTGPNGELKFKET